MCTLNMVKVQCVTVNVLIIMSNNGESTVCCSKIIDYCV